MAILEVEFPFRIGKAHPKLKMDVAMERKEDLVSFSMKYDMDLVVDDAELKSKEEVRGEFVYVYRFVDLDTAIEFMESRCARAVVGERLLDVEKVEKEMDLFMEKYEAGERRLKKKKKTIVVGEDGFMKYV
ncbi:hypothetical protein [Encephalitozoon cuniculi GB-M1]|uniref:Uncharacterized protein n=2 Tax=Encephalitozoon cuniculi TaxID=6035 RepID=Q8STM8_ENCCU|nr:uncharacterized protein ECU09_1580 [Encephalitozoon cuniculi GB-M1]AGE96343.1 hypothetical protein ECU09_1580 [Encephalitozoon cuniculi]UYI26851.1 archeaosine synthase QueF-like protein [Encephalitozoon cuniculi]CAD27130.1 hypothetical protein [Encephalitozoon cuniculi GB-M1]